MRRLCFIFLFLLISSSLWATAPVVFFSDMTDGPITGWEGSATKGAAVTIWGYNLGTSGTISCGGQTLSSSDSDQVAEWAATTNPTTARGLQRITFWLNSSMTTGSTTISATTSGGTSNSLTFYTRALGSNHIYFVDDSGSSNSYNGLYATYTSGSNGPWLTAGKVRGTLVAGDVAYFRSGTWNTRDSYGGVENGVITFTSTVYNNGSANLSITIKPYPAEKATLSSANYDTYFKDCIALTYYASNNLSYWTFSNFEMIGASACYEQDMTKTTSNIRIVGNDMSCIAYTPYSSFGILQINGPGGGSANFVAYGNYIHDLNVDYRGGPVGNGSYRSYPIYLQGYGLLDVAYIGWNELCHVQYGRGLQVFGHVSTDKITTLYVHDNYIHDVLMNSDVNGGDGTGDYNFVDTGYIYNNIWGSPTQVDIWENVCTGPIGSNPGKHGGTFYFYNNSMYDAQAYCNVFVADGEQTAVFKNNVLRGNSTYNYIRLQESTPGASGDHNCFYGSGAGQKPSWDTSTLDNTNPVWTTDPPTAHGSYFPQVSSPLIGAGTVLTYEAPNDTNDFYGVARGASWDIGAFEYAAEEEGSTAKGITGGSIRGGQTQ